VGEHHVGDEEDGEEHGNTLPCVQPHVNDEVYQRAEGGWGCGLGVVNDRRSVDAGAKDI
jgi:hypothetical protein